MFKLLINRFVYSFINNCRFFLYRYVTFFHCLIILKQSSIVIGRYVLNVIYTKLRQVYKSWYASTIYNLKIVKHHRNWPSNRLCLLGIIVWSYFFGRLIINYTDVLYDRIPLSTYFQITYNQC